MTEADDRIYALLPAVYRRRDAALGRPLQALCKVLSLEHAQLRENILGLYAQWFIETCEAWVVPYLGALVGVTGIDTHVANIPTQRARVANNIGYRSRRGIASTLANACGDASGWPALPVEYLHKVVTSANVTAIDHSALDSGALRPATPNLASPATLTNLDGPFGTVARTVCVTAIDRPRAHVESVTPEYYNIPNLGVFLWRTPALPIVGTDPGSGSQKRYLTFHPLGIDTPLLRPPAARATPWAPASADNVPLWITRAMLSDWTAAWREWQNHWPRASRHGLPALGFTIRIDGEPIPPHSIYVAPCHAGEDERTWLAREEAPKHPYAVVDPERGRFLVAAPAAAKITLDWAWGQAGHLGGGPYERGARTFRADPDTVVVLVSRKLARHGHELACAHLADAWREAKLRLAARDALRPQAGELAVLIRILDSETYEATGLHVPPGLQLTIEAAAGERPTLLAADDGVVLHLRAEEHAQVTLSGLLLGGTVEVHGELELGLVDVTIRTLGSPQQAALRWSVHGSASGARLTVSHSIIGAIRAARSVQVEVVASIIDGVGSWAVAGDEEPVGPELSLTAATVLGGVRTSALTKAEDSLITGVVRARSTTLSVLESVRFALELEGPDGERLSEAPISLRAPQPAQPFVSIRYGDPGYCQLRLDVGDELLRGGREGTELGAFRELASGQRLANLRPVLDEYLPWGIKAGVFVTGQASPRAKAPRAHVVYGIRPKARS